MPKHAAAAMADYFLKLPSW